MGLQLVSAAVASLSLLVSSAAAQAKSCPLNGPLSCQNTTAQADTCCFNAPGGSFLQTQFWDYNPSTGPVDSWTVHGLWPDRCDGTYDANCDARRAYTNITDILKASGNDDLLSYMQTYWKDYQGDDESFWEHEWGKHGTCISTLEPRCYAGYQPTQEVPDYFQRTVGLFKNLNSYQLLSNAGITPDQSKKYALSAVQAALAKGHSGKTPVVRCKSGAINEIWYYFNVRGSVQSGDFVPVESDGTTSNCPTSVSYVPKSGGSNPSPTSSTSATKTSTSATTSSTGGNGTPFNGKGYLNVVQSAKTNGCLISNGKWYTTGTCATFTATPVSSGNGFTLKGSKGSCGVLSDGSIDCSQSSGATFTSSSTGTLLVYSSSSKFYAAAAASGSTQQTVYVNSKAVEIAIQWQSQ